MKRAAEVDHHALAKSKRHETDLLDRAAVFASVAIRLVAGLLTFILMARGLGAESYGLVVTTVAWATLTSVLTDFGYTTRTLRDVAVNTAEAGDILFVSINIKFYISLLFIFLSVPFILFAFTYIQALSIILVFSAILLGTLGDICLSATRATSKYRAELLLTSFTSLIQIALIFAASNIFGSLIVISIFFFVSRILYTLAAIIFTIRILPPKTVIKPISLLRQSLSGSAAWAADGVISYVVALLDGIFVAIAFDLTHAGVYQAGSRFSQAATGFVVALSSIHVPRIARHKQLSSFIASYLFVLAELAAIGSLLGGGLWLGGPLITHYLLGPEYADVDNLWLALGLSIFLRYVGAAGGFFLVAQARITSRIAGQLLGLTVLSAGLALSWLSQDLVDVAYSVCACNLTVAAFYAIAVLRSPLVTGAKSIHK